MHAYIREHEDLTFGIDTVDLILASDSILVVFLFQLSLTRDIVEEC